MIYALSSLMGSFFNILLCFVIISLLVRKVFKKDKSKLSRVAIAILMCTVVDVIRFDWIEAVAGNVIAGVMFLLFLVKTRKDI